MTARETPTTGSPASGPDSAPLGIAVERVTAVDGATLALPRPGIDPALYRRIRDLAAGEVGCYLSHLQALEAFLASGHRFTVILKDDAVVDGRPRDLVAALTAPNAPRDWDLVKLESHHRSSGLTIRQLGGGFRLSVLPFRSAGTGAYLVGRNRAAGMPAGLSLMRMPYDIAFDRGWELGIGVRSVLPSPVAAHRSGSTIDISRADTVGKATPLGFRAAAKTMRFAPALHAWCSPTSVSPHRAAKPRGASESAGQHAGTAL